jgi:hypothetical protein
MLDRINVLICIIFESGTSARTEYCTISIYSVRPCDHDMFDGFGISVSTFEHRDRGKKFGRSGKN